MSKIEVIAKKDFYPLFKKGDKLVPAQNTFGTAASAGQYDVDYFAIALEDNTDDFGLIEALIL